ncbi:Bax inhibitor-1/YccA family protein [Marinicella litoralis]|uniref:Putative YccA/Bax inhibitor family protein n=1 Tax=Marinicella litoralis TaxID=644220 RepID=A0A4V3DIL2_9GAMM|nr:Bax inhibitor-1/YccA family protein [Marinicella litoralis]TDR22571.1 putative YccA/Bax inhibitor family protein [Marinicella litoralis]
MNFKGMKSSNPAMSKFEQQSMSLGPVDELIVDDSQRMTVNGTINKTGILLMIVVAVSAWSWNTMLSNPSLGYGLAIGGMIGAIIASLVVSFKPHTAPIGAPIVAALEGLFVGAISAIFEMRYPGLVVQALGLTVAVMFSMLFAYRTGLIRVTETFKKVMIFAISGIMLFYVASFILSFFGAAPSYFEMGNNSWFNIGLNLVIVGVAALSLVLDFDFIERASEQNTPKFMEWYGAFGLMVTLVWLYIELLRLLARFQDD